MPSIYTAADAAAYERLMGRWSPLLAERLIAFAGLTAGDAVLDLGCGTGSLALTLARRTEPRRILGVDIAPAYIDYAAGRSGDPRLAFCHGDATSLALPDAAFDRSFSLLALNFVATPHRALAELARVTRPGGTVAAAVWDFTGGLVYQRIFWDTAAALDPAAARARDRQLAGALTHPGEIEAAFAAAGLGDVAGATLTIRQEYRDFADYWLPIRGAEGPVGDYVKRLPPDRLAALETALAAAYGAGGGDGPRSFAASAWAAKGTVPPAAAITAVTPR
jgi:SAM-dependent methyltransferase